MCIASHRVVAGSNRLGNDDRGSSRVSSNSPSSVPERQALRLDVEHRGSVGVRDRDVLAPRDDP
jgi:hypothetical protein